MTNEHHTDHTNIRLRPPATTSALDEEQEIATKRRKVRKGTQSCWECKRRKIRCIFASSKDVTCIGCQRRRAPCVSQEMPEELSPAKSGNRHLGERIARVEDFMKDLLASKDVGATGQMGGELGQDRRLNSDALKVRSNDSAPSSTRAPLTPVEVRESPIIPLSISPNYRSDPWRVCSKFITPHTGPTRFIRSSRDRNSSSSLVCSLSS